MLWLRPGRMLLTLLIFVSAWLFLVQVSIRNRSVELNSPPFVRETVAGAALSKYYSIDIESAPVRAISYDLEIEHATRLLEAKKTARRVSRNSMTVFSGRWWERTPPLCYREGCPCTQRPPCFQPCDENLGCADVREGIEVQQPGTIVPNAMIGVPRGARPVGERYIRKSGRRESISVFKPRIILLLLDASQLAHASNESEQSGRGGALLRGIIEKFLSTALLSEELHIAIYGAPNFERSGLLVSTLHRGINGDSVEGELRRNLTWHSAELQNVRANIPQVVDWGVSYLEARPSSGYGEQHIVLLTDGATFCTPELSKVDGSTACDEWVRESHGPMAQLLDEYDRHVASLKTFVESDVPILVGKKISLSVMLVGNSLRPHELIYPSLTDPLSGCMTDKEMVERNYPKTIGSSWQIPLTDPNRRAFFEAGSRNGEYYYQPNIIFSIASGRTGGHWFPVREACPANDIGTDYSVELGRECVRSATSVFFRNHQPSRIKPGEEILANDYVVRNGELIQLEVQDARGRIVCDPARRTCYQQGADAIGLILSPPVFTPR